VITHVAFDFDGTLADSGDVAIASYNQIAELHGYGKLTAGNLQQLRGLSILERCKALGVPAYKLPALVLQVSHVYRKAVRSIEFFEGVPELLRELRGWGLKNVIVSTNEEGTIREFLKGHSAEGWVEDVICSSRIFGKAQLLRALMKRTRIEPHQLVYVGDEYRDIVACKKAGVRVIAVRWGFDAENRLLEAEPDAIATHPAEVADYVRRWSEM
jgi:phosphoglycolate phosphatase